MYPLQVISRISIKVVSSEMAESIDVSSTLITTNQQTTLVLTKDGTGSKHISWRSYILRVLLY